ncbi:MAG: hypothetical protein NTW75_15005 [Planctomycetales bacterium]|nr:hypothetical protein [Planctomycetales bacterium]
MSLDIKDLLFDIEATPVARDVPQEQLEDGWSLVLRMAMLSEIGEVKSIRRFSGGAFPAAFCGQKSRRDFAI